MNNTDTQSETQKTFYEILEQAVCSVTDKNLANPEFRERRIANFHDLQRAQSEYAKKLYASSRVTPEDMKMVYNYRPEYF
jgi:hypothetical protein